MHNPIYENASVYISDLLISNKGLLLVVVLLLLLVLILLIGIPHAIKTVR